MLLVLGPHFENLDTEKDQGLPRGCNPVSSCGLGPWRLRQVCANSVTMAVAMAVAVQRPPGDFCRSSGLMVSWPLSCFC